MSEIKLNTRLRLNQELLQSEIDGETIMMSIDNGEYYGLNSVASRIWEILKTEPLFSELLDTLTSEYDIDKNQCKTETLEFLNKLVTTKLIKIE